MINAFINNHPYLFGLICFVSGCAATLLTVAVGMIQYLKAEID